MIGAVVCLLLPLRVTNSVDHVLSMLVMPFSKGSRDLAVPINNLRRDRSSEISAKSYQQLENQFVNTRGELRYYQKLTEQLSMVRQQLGLERVKLVVARVTGSDTSNLREVKYLDRGASDQVQMGQAVLSCVETAKGGDGKAEAKDIYRMAVVGQIVGEAGKMTSNLQLVSDPGFCQKVVIEPNWQRGENWRAEGLLKGKGMGQIEVTMISTRDPVRPGDTVLSQLKDLSVEMIIGTVISCRPQENNRVEWQISVRPAVDLYNLREVVVVGN
jgi:cell shape-determining protein MreC